MTVTAVGPQLRGDGRTARPLEAMALLVARLRTAAREAERVHLAQELDRIADELVTVRHAIMNTGTVTDAVVDHHRPGYHAARRNREVNPEPGMRRCSICRTVLPVGMFTVTDARTGKLRAECRPCHNERQRTRYVRAGYKIVTVELLDGDPCVGHRCPVCGEPFEVGQRVEGDHVRHDTCSGGAAS